MRSKKTQELLDKADDFKIKTSQVLQEANQCLFDCWELLLAEKGLALLD